MPTSMREIIKRVFDELKKNGISATPENYKTLFCKMASEYGFDTNECDRFDLYAKKLTKNEQLEIEKNEIHDIDDLFDFVVYKLRLSEKALLKSDAAPVFSEETVEKMASLLIASLVPSYTGNIQLDNMVKEFSDNLKQNPSIVEDKYVQKNLANLIENKRNFENFTIKEKTGKLIEITKVIDEFIETIVNHSGDSSQALSKLSNKLHEITYEEIDENSFDAIKNQMLDISSVMQTTVNSLSDILSTKHKEIDSLKKKIKKLEANLEEAQKESKIDFLTGTLTRREYELRLQDLEEYYQNRDVNYVITFLDIDYFKKINDTYGHDAGDEVLSIFGNLLLKQSNSNDIIGRYGGEEFVILSKNTIVSSVEKNIETIQSLVRRHNFIYENQKIKLTFSAGIVSRGNYKTLEQALKTADSLVYKAKKNGRDRLECEVNSL